MNFSDWLFIRIETNIELEVLSENSHYMETLLVQSGFIISNCDFIILHPIYGFGNGGE